MQLQQEIDLKPYNTFSISSTARYFSIFHNVEELGEVLEAEKNIDAKKHMILGGGSNILLSGDVDGLVLKNEIEGIKVISEDADHIYIKVGAGENWHQFVLYCVQNGYAGIENLS